MLRHLHSGNQHVYAAGKMLAQTILALALAATALANEPTDRKATHQFTFLSVFQGRVYCDKACPAEGYDLDVPANVPAKDGGWATPDTPLGGPLTVQIDGADGTVSQDSPGPRASWPHSPCIPSTARRSLRRHLYAFRRRHPTDRQREIRFKL